METPERWDGLKKSSVFGLITRLCEKTVSAYEVTEDFGSFNKNLVKKLRARFFDILLKKSEVVVSDEPSEPSMDLLTHYYTDSAKKKNIADYDKLISIKEKIDWIIDRDRTKDEPYFTEVLACVVSLRNSVQTDHGKSMFEMPFSFGKLEEILPSPIQASICDPKPYKYFPAHFFELPFTTNEDCTKESPSLYYISTDFFTSKPGTNLTLLGRLSAANMHSVSSRSSRGGLLSLSSQYANSVDEGFPSCPRLTAPRDLVIPLDDYLDKTRKITIGDDGYAYPVVQEIIHLEASGTAVDSKPSMCLWDFACMETKIHKDLWEEASKMPAVDRRGLISLSITQMIHWKKTHINKMSKMKIILEAQFILHIKYLMIGIQSSSFNYDKELERFVMKAGLCLEGMLQSSLETYISQLLVTGTCYWKLNLLVTPTPTGDDIIGDGFVYKSMCDSIRQYLVWFRLEVDKIFGEEMVGTRDSARRMPTLLEILHQLQPLGYQIQTMAKIYKIYEIDSEKASLRGAGLMAYLYNEITQVTQSQVSSILYAMLQATCCAYFRFIQRFIFEGELEDYFGEFFIKKDFSNIDSYNRRYWDKGFVIRNNEMVPEFLRGLEKHVLLCGKSLRLLKLCNPDDPLCFLLSTEYPLMKCCLTFTEIESQQKLYEMYRTQCLYVCGEPVTFQSLLIQKDSEKKAFREMVILRQAETMEKLIDERRRLSHIVTANKRRQFAELREAAEKAAAQRGKKKQEDIQQDTIFMKMSIEADMKHNLKLEENKKKVIAYYTEIGREVEMRQMKAEWKIKRLKLDPRRVQLLTSEKTNLSRERLELEHKSLEDVSLLMQTSITMEEPAKIGDIFENVESMTDSLENIISESGINNDREMSVPSFNPLTNEDLNEAVLRKLETLRKTPKQLRKSISPQQATSNITKDLNDTDSNESENQTVDAINKNMLSSLKVHKSLDTDLSPSDILNSNSLPGSKATSFSNQKIHDTYLALKLEAKRNQQKVMADEFDVGFSKATTTALKSTNQLISPVDNQQMQFNFDNNCNDAYSNKLKSLNSQTFGVDNQVATDRNCNETPHTEAGREALRNKQKILNHDFDMAPMDNTLGRIKQRGNLTLNLKSVPKALIGNWSGKKVEEQVIRPMSIDSTPDNFLITPSDQFQARLDLETPITFGVDPNGLPSAGTLSPTSAQIADHKYNSTFNDDGFRFPKLIEDESDDGETIPDFGKHIQEIKTPETEKSFSLHTIKSKVWNFTTDDLNFNNFRPFTIESTANNSISSFDIFDESLNINSPRGSPYSDLVKIITTTEKKPMTDIFKSICNLEEEECTLQRIANVDFSTIAACLQRSVLIPLSYQMEMVNNATLKYFLVNCELYDHLKSLRDYFFLMDGEFAKTICINLFEKLNSTESPRELLNFATLHSILDKSFGSSIGASNKHAENLSFIVNDMPLSFHHSSPDVLECLSLSYAVAWPLNIILSQETLDKYTRVFQFLVKIRRISWALEQDCEVLKLSLKEEFMVSRELLRSPEYHAVQIYRYIMSALVRALHCYVLTTCLQSSWTEFEKDLIGARTLDDLYTIHDAYIKKVLFRCLLNKRSTPMMKMLNDIFTTILRFHHLLNARCWHIAESDVHYTHPLFYQMHELYLIFEKLAKNLHKTAVFMSNCGYQPHLVELLAMISMNGYYSTPSSKERLCDS